VLLQEPVQRGPELVGGEVGRGGAHRPPVVTGVGVAGLPVGVVVRVVRRPVGSSAAAGGSAERSSPGRRRIRRRSTRARRPRPQRARGVGAGMCAWCRPPGREPASVRRAGWWSPTGTVRGGIAASFADLRTPVGSDPDPTLPAGSAGRPNGPGAVPTLAGRDRPLPPLPRRPPRRAPRPRRARAAPCARTAHPDPGPRDGRAGAPGPGHAAPRRRVHRAAGDAAGAAPPAPLPLRPLRHHRQRPGGAGGPGLRPPLPRRPGGLQPGLGARATRPPPSGGRPTRSSPSSRPPTSSRWSTSTTTPATTRSTRS
jgi:hypothetical protein